MTEKEFISCYNEYFDMVWRICYVELSGRRHDVEDAVSDSFLKLYKSYSGSVNDRERLKAWLIVTTQNTCRSMLRLAYRRVISLDEHIAAAGEPAAPEQGGELAEALSHMGDTERSVMMLYYYFGYSAAEISQMLDMKEGTVYSTLSRGRKRLAALLKGGEDDAG
ncbi:RNA polymerase sigma factor [Ruminococcus sp. NK3A76]|uniref:RNA polymerase sigma factor n=1 Tax=Ruminococcus sp. NK3A76 TaxID=877411 RepID=UPI0018DD3FCE|nr:RNA polymerase sigma factor [Ruminococcus sp. NK3A76]